MEKKFKFLSVVSVLVLVVIGLFGGGQKADATCGTWYSPAPRTTVKAASPGNTRCAPYGYGGMTITTHESERHCTINGAEYAVYDSNNRLVATCSAPTIGIGVVSNLPYGRYKVIQTKAPQGYELNTLVQWTTISYNSKSVTVPFVNKKEVKKGKISISLSDKFGNALEGADFTVVSGSYRAILTTDRYGQINLSQLPYGTYTVTEVKAPNGYKLDPKSKTIVLSDYASNGYLSFVNEKDLDDTWVQINLKDDEGKRILNAQFTITGAGYSRTGRTDINGQLLMRNMPFGSYEVQQKSTAEGYVIDDKARKVTFTKQDPNKTLDFVNKKEVEIGHLLLELENDKGTPLAGADFKITSKAYTAMVKTDAAGKIELSDLPYGTYTAEQTSAPAGHIKDTKKQQVTISSKLPNGYLSFINKQEADEGSIVISTEDEDGKKMAGVEYQITGGKYSAKRTTGKDGKITLSKLSYTKFTITQTKVPEGYVKDANPKEVTLTKQDPNSTVNFVVKQEKDAGALEIILEDQDGKALEGAEFEIDGPEGIELRTTKANGKIELKDLGYGSYIVKQTEAPYGYEKDRYRKKVVLTKKSPKGSFTFTNKKDEGRLTILLTNKFDETGDKFKNIEFIIKGEKGFKTTAKTDAAGKIDLKDLAYGEYKVTQKEAPANHKIDRATQTVTLDKYDKEENLKFVNIPMYGRVEIIVEDQNGDAVEGASFSAKSMKSPTYYDITTGPDGKAVLNDVPFDEDFNMVGLKLAGYEMDVKQRNIKVTEKDLDKKIYITYKKL